MTVITTLAAPSMLLANTSAPRVTRLANTAAADGALKE
jgi:hypothetical protein